ncbi:hypothetical protein KM043_007962 [Ampulex compressa]|nr:hypothetical protein KM043_007962 [Ampulex compressa]
MHGQAVNNGTDVHVEFTCARPPEDAYGIHHDENMSAETSSICISVLCIYVLRGTPTRPRLASTSAASLEILPSGEKQTKTVGSSIMLTCKPNVDDLQLISNMQWLDPHNRVIESLKLVVLPIESTSPGYSKPPMYTELQRDKSLSLIFNSLQEDHDGKYTCKGTYANTIPLNKSVTIDTIVAITWVNAPLNQYPILGEDFAIQCKVQARPPPSVDWLYNGELIKTNDHYIIDTYALKIKNVQESDDGIYTCRASVLATGELNQRQIRVEVHVRPKIEEMTNPVEIVEGENANIQCKATGKPPPKFTWVKSQTQQNLSMVDRFGVDSDTGMLTITNVNRDDAGEYQCTASNAADTVTTAIMVNVIVKPKIMEFLNSTVVQDKEAELTCKVFGRPPPQVTFRKFTSKKPYVLGVQSDDSKIILANNQDEASGWTIGVLTINEALRSNDGLYECIAQNAGGVAYKNGHLTVEFPPSFASMPNVTVWSWDQRPVNISCIAESIPNATIRWTMPGGQNIDDPMIEQSGNGPVSLLKIVPLDRRYYTSYKCIAANTHGMRERIIELREATRPAELLSSKMIEITATTIKFELEPPTTHPELTVRTITVQYKEGGQTWTEARNKTWSVGTPYVVEGLKPQTPYEFRFAAGNVVGLGNFGTFYSETTPGRTVPNEPKIIMKLINEYDVSPYSNEYELTWLPPPDNGEPIDLYQIKYCQVKRVSGEWELLEDTCRTVEVKSQGRTRHWLKELYSDTFYRVELKAHNAIGYSKPGMSKFKTGRESMGINVDYTVDSAPGDTSKSVVTAITAAIMILYLTI